MSFYTDFFYGEGFYGAVTEGGIDVPVELAFYRTNTDGVYVFHWGFQEAFINPNIISPSFDFDLEIDTVTTFDSGNLQTFDKSTVLTYQNGAVRKGAAIVVNTRKDKSEQTWYWRVRTKVGLSVSNWSVVAQFTILEKFEVEEAENLLNNLPDYHVYGKGDLKRAVSDRASKLYKICDMYGKELDQTKLEDILTATNNYIALCRDEQLYQNFGFFFDYTKPQVQTSVEYRNTLRNLLLGSLTGGTFSAIRSVVKSFTGVTPILGTIAEREDFFLNTILTAPPETPNGTRQFFSTWDGGLSAFTIVSVVDTTHLQVNSVVSIHEGDKIFQGSAETRVSAILDFTHILVASTTGFSSGAASNFTPVSYVPGTLVVLLNGVAQDPGYYTVFENPSDPNNPTNAPTRDAYVEDVFAPGFKMTNAPASLDVLTTCYDIGVRTDPTPVILDPTDRLSLTGTATFTHGMTLVTGIGSAFLTQLHKGDLITDPTGLTIGLVETVETNISLTLKYPWVGDTETVASFRLNYNSSVHVSGIVTFTNGSTAVTGSASNFEVELQAGDTIMDDYGITGKILSVTDGANLVLTAPWTGSHPITIYYPSVATPYPNVHTRVLVYEDMTLWSKSSLADGLIIKILNPGLFDLPRPLLETLVKLLIPAHVLVFFEYE